MSHSIGRILVVWLALFAWLWNIVKCPIAQVTCYSLGDCDAVLLRGDWVPQLRPAQYNRVTLCQTHSNMYHSLRGSLMCYRKDFCDVGADGPEGHSYFPTHITSVVTPSPPTAEVPFATCEEQQANHKPGSGMRSFPDTFLLDAIGELRRQGFLKPADIVEELADMFGGALLGNAFRVRDLSHVSDVQFDETQERLRKTEIRPDAPRPAPTPHKVTPSPVEFPPIPGYPEEEGLFLPFDPSIGEWALFWANPREGAVLPTTTTPAGPPLFSTTAALPPIPGVNGAPGGALCENSLLTSMVYRVGRIANPDINPNPGTMEGVRRNGEIHVRRAFSTTILWRCDRAWLGSNWPLG